MGPDILKKALHSFFRHEALFVDLLDAIWIVEGISGKIDGFAEIINRETYCWYGMKHVEKVEDGAVETKGSADHHGSEFE